MVALIDDDLSVLGDAIVHDTFADEALNDRHIEQPGRLVAAAANAANRLRREVEKRRQTFDPLVQELAPMHEHQRIDAALAISQAATTVLPNAVVAAKTPVSCFSIVSAASFCSVRSSP